MLWHSGQFLRIALAFGWLALAMIAGGMAHAAPFASMVIDARSGEVLHSENADTRLHPASLTKMMTLYVAFEAIANGEISLDTDVKISRFAAAEPPSELGLRAGQTIKLRYLIRAAAIKSANDAATAIGEAIEGSEAAFAQRMNRTAKAMGMTRTTFKNAHGLTQDGHLSTARDMTTLGRNLFFHYNQYYNLFKRVTTDAGIREVSNTNRRFLSDYEGADGIKTGYTRAAGFNLVASAKRGPERVIATVFGGRSTAQRNAKVAELLDLGFRKAATNVAERPPARPHYDGPMRVGKTISLVRAVATSPRPKPRPVQAAPPLPADLIATISEEVQEALTEKLAEAAPETAAPPPATAVAAIDTVPVPLPRPESIALAAFRQPSPEPVGAEPVGPEIVTRLSTSGGRQWGITIGRFGSRYAAEQVLLKTALAEIGTLDEALRKVVQRNGGFDANFVGMTQDHAALACRRLQARRLDCATFGPAE